MFKKIATLCSLVLLSTAVSARADQLFTGVSGFGVCCYNVDLKDHADLSTIGVNQIQVSVTLTDGATFFAATGSGQHPGFAFNLNGDPSITITNVSPAGWSVNTTPVSTNGPDFGTFDYWLGTPGSGTSAGITSLVFDVNLTGITYSSFVINNDDYYFAADILGIGGTGEGGIHGTPGVTPEPSSLLLLGTGIMGAAGLFYRKLSHGEVERK